MIYEYTCKSCANTQEAFRKVAERENTPKCEVCDSDMRLIISVCGGFKVPGGENPNFSSRAGKSRYLFDKPVGPLDKRSRAYQKKMDDENSNYYGPGQTAGMSSKELREFKRREDGLSKGQTKFR